MGKLHKTILQRNTKGHEVAVVQVQENIEYFGGDSDEVTLMGVSSGGASVQLHMLSELSKGKIV